MNSVSTIVRWRNSIPESIKYCIICEVCFFPPILIFILLNLKSLRPPSSLANVHKKTTLKTNVPILIVLLLAATFYFLPISESLHLGSSWVSPETRPEHFARLWRSHYAPGEPNHSGRCLYLSVSHGLKWRDTSCRRHKRHESDPANAVELG